MITLANVLLILSFASFTLAAFSVPVHPRLNFVGLGLAFYVLAELVGKISV